jgi:hypothetical protein
VRRRSTHAA